MNKYMDKAIFHDMMIPMIRSTSPALSDFDFEKLDLGEIVGESIISFLQFENLSFFYSATENWRSESLYGKYSRSNYDGY